MIDAIAQNRWWIYQRERFPLISHGILIAAFSFSSVSLSALLRGTTVLPAASSVLVAFCAAFVFFLQLRIADEFKDAEEDARYRSYRPVPRGLVTLRELGSIGLGVMALQLVLSLWLQSKLVLVLMLVWIYWGLMCKEFFVADWLRERPFTYMWTHMLIMPIIDLYTTACDWLVNGNGIPPVGLTGFLLVSFFNGCVIEIGRKIRVPQDEEEGVDTYSVVWGKKKAVALWFGMLILTAIFAVATAKLINFAVPVMIIFGALLTMAVYVAWRYFAKQETGWGKWFEHLSSVWTLLMYLSLGTIPILIRASS